ncbi:MAG: serine/threonine protein phosphatase [Planctomycetaceae bacterium]|nr:serine/threonine protein phosphatase [Planctomycetaceae bacterium]
MTPLRDRLRIEVQIGGAAISKHEPTSVEGRLIAIGDIHGCSTALRTLLEAIGPRLQDTIVTLGDYVDWGPDSRGVIELLMDLSKQCHLVSLRGNHEEMLLEALELEALGSDAMMRSWLALCGEETLSSYPYEGGDKVIPKEHVEFLRNCQDYYETAAHIFVHANYDPQLPLDQTPRTTLGWKFIDDDELQMHVSGKTVVVGHTPQVSGLVLNRGFLVGIDTDCSRGGWLTALNVNNQVVTQANQEGRIRMSVLT